MSSASGPSTDKPEKEAPPRPEDRHGFQIAIICALNIEADAVEALMDEFYEEDEQLYEKAEGDRNHYTTGRIGQHPVVLTILPEMGKGASAQVSSTLMVSFPSIRLGIVVGICGAAPKDEEEDEDILLGDVIISTGIVRYDFGRQYPNVFARKNTLEDVQGRPATEIRGFIKTLQGKRNRQRLEAKTLDYSYQLGQQKGYAKSKYPGAQADKLFESEYRHKHYSEPCKICDLCHEDNDEVCDQAINAQCKDLGCSDDHLLSRTREPSTAAKGEPHIHFGKIASADTVLKSASHRDKIIKAEKAIGFEMEGAGTWDNFPTIIVKSACDYADSHKNKGWQSYAAATAASCMKAFLEVWKTSSGGRSATTAASGEAGVRDQSKNAQKGGGAGGGNMNVSFGTASVRDQGKIIQLGNVTTNRDIHF